MIIEKGRLDEIRKGLKEAYEHSDPKGKTAIHRLIHKLNMIDLCEIGIRSALRSMENLEDKKLTNGN